MASETKNLFIFAAVQPLHPDEGAAIAIQDVLWLSLKSAATGKEGRKLGDAWDLWHLMEQMRQVSQTD